MTRQENNTLLTGQLEGLKPSQRKRLERLVRRRYPASRIVTPELARALTEASAELQRQLGVLLDRGGHVYSVIVGDAGSLFLPEFPRRARDRFSGLRLVHTHLKSEPLSEDDLTDLALLRLDIVAAIGVDENGLPGPVYIAHLLPDNPAGDPYEQLPATRVHAMSDDFLDMMQALEDEFARQRKPREAGDLRDRAILVHVSTQSRAVAEDSIAELRELARSAGTEVVDTLIQRRDPDPRFVVGQGRLKQTIIRAMQLGAEVLVFDLSLSPSQVKAVADYTDLKILDRTQLIMDIFAQHAVTREGKLQVELAQLRYLLPRLGMKSTAFSRLTGGIGGRGPGETKLEIDRRRAYDRLARLEREVKQLGERRGLRRGQRERRGVPVVSIVGYTNAGKSTLLNQLTHSEVIAEDALFATLNPVSRRLRFPHEREIVITDTVGFIRNLPEDLKAAFRTTFEELHQADLLLHVVDASSEDIEEKFATVVGMLKELELSDKPMRVVLNKTDLVSEETVRGLAARYAAIPVSAHDRNTFGPLLRALETSLWAQHHPAAQAQVG